MVRLGAGKTSFARALLTALGVGERVKSPTYSLIEGYEAQGMPAWHLDLYRIADPGELEWLGLDALSDPAGLGAGGVARARRRRVASDADMECIWSYAGNGRHASRCMRVTARGERLLGASDEPPDRGFKRMIFLRN
jgi:tRNA threonylcarbamoyladenosine biosynthesis protein TsaE